MSLKCGERETQQTLLTRVWESAWRGESCLAALIAGLDGKHITVLGQAFVVVEEG